MSRLSAIFVVFACLATIALTGCAGNVAAQPAGVTMMSRAYMPTRFTAQRAVVPDFEFPYQGGPVLVDPKVYLILWGYKKYGDPEHVAKLLTDYFNVMGGSGHNNIYTQYYDIVDGQTNYITNPKHQLGGVWFDNTDPVPQSPTDEQVAEESLNGVTHFGYNVNGSYVVATPHGHSTSGFGTEWCAYSAGDLVSYTNLPYIPDAGANCGASFIASPPKDERAVDEGVTIVEGTQEGDSVTDPDPGTGWYSLTYGEISSPCAWADIAVDRFGKKFYVMGAMFSNASQTCVQTYSTGS
jgi:hypothetical protein